MKSLSHLFIKILACSFLPLGLSCTEQHDPTPQWNTMKKEHKLAHRVLPKLTAEGKLPPIKKTGSEPAVEVSEVDQKYSMLCASCHGPAGDAQTPAGQALVPKPRDFTDPAWHGKVGDEQIAKVIKDGGVAAGMSPTMAAWGAMLNTKQISDMVVKIRAFKR